MNLTMVEYACEQCGTTFKRRIEGKRKYRFCSNRCANIARTRLTAEVLRPYAENGTRSCKISEALKTNAAAVLPALRRNGLYRLWCERRYKKCASPMVGPTLVTTVSAEAISQSAESVVLLATGMNCGG